MVLWLASVAQPTLAIQGRGDANRSRWSSTMVGLPLRGWDHAKWPIAHGASEFYNGMHAQ